jgi:hypothetical protein
MSAVNFDSDVNVIRYEGKHITSLSIASAIKDSKIRSINDVLEEIKNE